MPDYASEWITHYVCVRNSLQITSCSLLPAWRIKFKYHETCDMQEPSPFSHVSGMKIRFLTLIRELRAAGDDVTVITPDMGAPDDYHGARVRPDFQLRKNTISKSARRIPPYITCAPMILCAACKTPTDLQPVTSRMMVWIGLKCGANHFSIFICGNHASASQAHS